MVETDLLIRAKGGERVERMEISDPWCQSFWEHRPGTIFQSREWLNVIAEANGLRPVCYTFRQGEDIQMALTGFLFDWKLGKIFFGSLYDGGFLGPPDRIGEFLDALLPQLKKEGVTSFRIMKTFSAPLEELEGFHKVQASQHVIDLAGLSEEKLWNQVYRNRVRKAIRKALRENIKVVPIDRKEKAEQLFGLNQETLKRRKTFSSFNLRTVGDIYENFVTAGKARGWLATKEGLPIAGLLNVYSPEASHALIGGSRGDYLELPANDLLLHEAIKDAIQKGKRYFDFMCALPSPSIKSFKEKFGAREYPACFFELDLAPTRARLWKFLWKCLHTPLGGALARKIFSSP